MARSERDLCPRRGSPEAVTLGIDRVRLRVPLRARHASFTAVPDALIISICDPTDS